MGFQIFGFQILSLYQATKSTLKPNTNSHNISIPPNCLPDKKENLPTLNHRVSRGHQRVQYMQHL